MKLRWRGSMLAVGVAAVRTAGWFMYATVNIVSPSQVDLDKRVVAVVSLAPQTHRLLLAQQLVANGLAEVGETVDGQAVRWADRVDPSRQMDRMVWNTADEALETVASGRRLTAGELVLTT